MQPNRRKIGAGQQLLELPEVIAGINRRANRCGEHTRVASPQRSGDDALLALARLMLAQRGDELSGKRNGALAALGLGLGEDQAATTATLQSPANPQQPSI
jgi:hypothetical protein